MYNEHVVFLDLETTGGSPVFDRIIEIGLIEVDRGRYVGEWSTLVNPGRRIPQAIQTLTGITDEMVASAPTFGELSAALAGRLEGKVLAAHNARFDYGFLKSELQRAGLQYMAPVLCTVRLSRRLFPQHRRHNLDALIMRHALFCLDRHRALGDARALWELAQIWREMPGEETVGLACAELLRRPVVPPGLPADIFDTLPESAGVYVFYGEGDCPLYVGRSANVRSRVMSHFTGDKGVGKDARIAEAVKRVDWTETAGELGASLREARLIGRLAPLYNRASSREAEPCTWRWRPEDPATPPQLVGASDIEPGRFSELYGLFGSRSAARTALRGLVKAHSLCRVMMGLEARGEQPGCAEYRAQRCRGACAGAESAIGHSMRALKALAGLRLRPWPYAGRIGVRERDAEGRYSELHVLDRWRYLGTVQSEAELHELADSPTSDGFDASIYRILARFLGPTVRSWDILALPLDPSSPRS